MLSFYYNYVLLQPILWTLFGVLFSYVALYRPKVRVVKALVFLLGPREKHTDVTEDFDDESITTWYGVVFEAVLSYFRVAWRVIWFCVVPSVGTTASSVYFSVLYRLMILHSYNTIVLRYFPDISTLLLRIITAASAVIVTGKILAALRQTAIISKKRKLKKQRAQAAAESPVDLKSAIGLSRAQSPTEDAARSMTLRVLHVQDRLEWFLEFIRIFLAKLILPQAHLIAAVLVLTAATLVIGTLTAWTVYAFSDEVVYIYRNLANVVRMLNSYLSHFAYYTLYVDKAYGAASEWITSAVMADSASAKTRDLYDFMVFVAGHQHELGALAPVSVPSLSVAAATAAVALASTRCSAIPCDPNIPASTCSEADTFLPTIPASAETVTEYCRLSAVTAGRVPLLGNATRAIISAVNQDLESFVDNPYALVDGFWELTEYYQDELKSGGSIAKGGDYLLTGLNYLKEILLQSGSISFAAIGSSVSVFTFLFDSVLQAVIYVTALFLLLQSNVGFYHYTAVLLHFVDPSTMLYRAIHRGLRAILISSLKMAIFHAGFVWLLFSFSEFPLVCIPTIVAFILGLVPVVSPVIVAAIPLPIWAYAHDENVWAIVIMSTCFVVWWSVGTSIYAEIPDSSVWMTTFSVGLGISLFGPRGVIIGPAIATIPFALYAIGSAYISDSDQGAPATSVGGSVRFLPNFMRLNSTPRASNEHPARPPTRKARKVRKNLGGMTSDGTPSARSSARPSGPSTPPQGIEELITSGDGNRARLFDYIMNTPR